VVQRYTQTVDDLVGALAQVAAVDADAFSAHVIAFIGAIPEKTVYAADDLHDLMQRDFDAAATVFRLVLGLSKDEYESALRAVGCRAGVKAFHARPQALLDALVGMGLLGGLGKLVNEPPTWRDLLIDRLRSGRGRALKGQSRGRALEDFVEEIVKDVFGAGGYEARCTFVGREGKTEKADFAIPSKSGPQIVIEVKAYGATGSKQTDVIGDIERITAAKRPDTSFMLVTDGLTWLSRLSDFRKIVALQNAGEIMRIYTVKMAAALSQDLLALKAERGL
jgi:hypothetical protein